MTSFALAAQTREHAGIVFAKQQTGIGKIILGVVLIWEILEPVDMVGRIEFL